MPLYLGLDASTQSLTAMLLEVPAASRAAGSALEVEGAVTKRIVFEHAIDFDADLPHHGTHHGVLPHDDPAVAHAPPLLWAEALDRMMEALVGSGIDLSELVAIAGSGQQHGSVWLHARATAALAALAPSKPLVDQLRSVPTGDEEVPFDSIFSRRTSPIWMDSSTAEECGEITAAIGGAAELAHLTGSRAFERFTGPQIRKLFKHRRSAYAATEKIHLVSSFMASLLAGQHAALEPGDAAGMNLMDLGTLDWSPIALQATAPGLKEKLPPIAPSSSIVGELAPYWQQRFGLPPARVVVWSGDNPCSLVGTGLFREGQLAVSLGTSDTIFGPMREPRVDESGTGHVFGAPTGEFMGLTCFLNGSLARERVRDDYGLDWNGFSEALRTTPPGNDGALMFPWFAPEITPSVDAPAARRVGLDADDGPRNVRAVVEAQMMALANHSRWMGVDIDVIHATGGGAANREILQIMADVFDAEVRRFASGNAACLGAALRALHADRIADGRAVSWQEVVDGIAVPEPGAIRPDPAAVPVYAHLRRRYAKLEPLAIVGCRRQ